MLGREVGLVARDDRRTDGLGGRRRRDRHTSGVDALQRQIWLVDVEPAGCGRSFGRNGAFRIAAGCDQDRCATRDRGGVNRVLNVLEPAIRSGLVNQHIGGAAYHHLLDAGEDVGIAAVDNDPVTALDRDRRAG